MLLAGRGRQECDPRPGPRAASARTARTQSCGKAAAACDTAIVTVTEGAFVGTPALADDARGRAQTASPRQPDRSPRSSSARSARRACSARDHRRPEAPTKASTRRRRAGSSRLSATLCRSKLSMVQRSRISCGSPGDDSRWISTRMDRRSLPRRFRRETARLACTEARSPRSLPPLPEASGLLPKPARPWAMIGDPIRSPTQRTPRSFHRRAATRILPRRAGQAAHS